ncbi:hypothetical protein XAC3810_460009 [Xanthomonas citri pv. citri]|uniref:Uncharacterized protein n=1 Tax=Xanthomonas citri pv. citri TaxID=611301 RepID=A0A0U5FEG3_XANCI|nr:hypothetical protein XAC9322_480004 [Xanthomonas citri pv. citri]CEE31016.1 hypothetical protein XAC1083_460009 [Xanthomonas citri pv. citri]CEE40318.1 hypothetical protein XAC3810_460009 [Xanthomonas citri pv. citri]CEE45465.1 hypothetical protein XAC908_680012 [Xanthomonas citri pv. citri]CEE67328.1 hypothetical protein XACW160_470011 [Xanthomonas citri pv. citri]
MWPLGARNVGLTLVLQEMIFPRLRRGRRVSGLRPGGQSLAPIPPVRLELRQGSCRKIRRRILLFVDVL